MELYLIWLIVGAVLILLEFIIPGGIICFLGGGCLTVALGIYKLYMGWITNYVEALLTFFISSLILIMILRSFFMKYFEGNSSIQNVNEDLDDQGSIVEVVEDILPHKEGRVKYKDSTWSAQSDSEILKGEKAVILDRKGSTWTVKPL